MKAWLAPNPRFVVHVTPTYASWMNLAEVWFSLIEPQALRRGVFTSVRDLTTKIGAYIEGWDERSHPFIWTRTADESSRRSPDRDFKCAPLGRTGNAVVRLKVDKR